MRFLFRFICVLALGVMGCSETSGAGGAAGDGGQGGVAGSPGVGGAGGDGGSAQNNPELEAFLDDYVYERMTDDDPGVAVALIGPGGVVELEKTYGMANVEESVRIDSHTLFDLASVSKQFTATAVMILYEEAVLSLEDLVVDVFPEAPAEWAPMTVHHLLTHQSGLPDFWNDQIVAVSRGWTNEEILAYLLETSLDFPPGDQFKYTNSGFVMLALLLERATGERFEDFIQERVFEPLAMGDSVVSEGAPPDLPNLAHAYILGAAFEYTTNAMGHSDQFSSLDDMIQWELGVRDATLLSPDTLSLMFTKHIEAADPGCGFGYGWVICDRGLGVFQNHDGRAFAFRTFIEREPAEGLTVIMLSNGSYEWAYQIGPALRTFYVENAEAAP